VAGSGYRQLPGVLESGGKTDLEKGQTAPEIVDRVNYLTDLLE
jgi:hypothetical protein